MTQLAAQLALGTLPLLHLLYRIVSLSDLIVLCFQIPQVSPGTNITVATDTPVETFSLVRYSTATHSVNTDQRRAPLPSTLLTRRRHRQLVRRHRRRRSPMCQWPAHRLPPLCPRRRLHRCPHPPAPRRVD